MGSPNLSGKTMLYILDGLYGTYTNVGQVTERDRWKNLFNKELGGTRQGTSHDNDHQCAK